MKYNHIILQPLKKQRFKVVKDIYYKDIKVPRGYKTNGADIPRIFWSFIPPNRSDLLPAVVVHDYLCDLEQYEKADLYFREILEELKIDKKLIWILVGAVKAYHFFRYRLVRR